MAEDHFAQIRLFRELLTLSPAQQFCVDEWEADDVVATLARKLAARGVSVTCHSNDMDYLQLEANPLITINGIQKREEIGRASCRERVCQYVEDSVGAGTLKK